MKRLPTLSIALAALLAVAGCSTTHPDVVSHHEAQRLATVLDAVVLTTRPVGFLGSQSGLGPSPGSEVRFRAGSRESVVIGILGAVVGGVIGNAVERSATREEAVEILVQLKNGDRRSVVQAKAVDNFAPGDPVILVSSGGRVRVTRAPVVQPAATTSAAPAKT